MPHAPILIPTGTRLYTDLDHLASRYQMVFCAGLPGVGKSLIVNQLARMAHNRGRRVWLLQWDVCRAPFDSHPEISAAYPERAGVTDPAVRCATGIWARNAIGQWLETQTNGDQILIGEISLVGNRLVELLRIEDDRAETGLSAQTTHFVTPVPTKEIRAMIEAQREQRSATPQHEREKADAIPDVMRSLWGELYEVTNLLGLPVSTPNCASGTYDPDVYSGVFSALMKHRNHSAMLIDTLIDTTNHSVYDLDIGCSELVPSPGEVSASIADVERLYADRNDLENHVSRWYQV